MPKRPDIYIALVAATGTDVQQVRDSLTGSFCRYGYSLNYVKISSLIATFYDVSLDHLPYDERARTLMDLGDRLRREFKNGNAPMKLAINRIRKIRQDVGEEGVSYCGDQVFLIDSLKNTEEVAVLDKIYGRNLYTLSVFSDETRRIDRIAHKIADSAGLRVSDEHIMRATAIVREDLDRGDNALSQDVINTFPLADFFIAEGSDFDKQVNRFTDLVFGAPYITPTLDEFGMFIAKASSYRSCDLSRQVGASILDDKGAVLATGCNEVPVPGGGFFYDGRQGATDNRDHKAFADPNYKEMQGTVTELISNMKNAGLLSENLMAQTAEELASSMMHGSMKAVLKGTRIRSLIEFGRIVHAEMHALSDAARRGVSVAHATLYCTTFPCHVCGRHIIAAGIDRVVYIEPYPKSLLHKLYKNEIDVQGSSTKPINKVSFLPFMGVAPTLYQRAFRHRSGKTSTGAVAPFNRANAAPHRALDGVVLPNLEIFFSLLEPSGAGSDYNEESQDAGIVHDESGNDGAGSA